MSRGTIAEDERDIAQDDPASSVRIDGPAHATASWSRERLTLVGVLLALSIGALVVAVMSAISIAGASQDSADRDAITEVVGDFATAVVTISPETIDDDLAKIAGYTTGELADGLEASSTDQAALVDQLKVAGTGSVSESGVQSLSGDEAVVLVALRAEQLIGAAADRAQQVGYRMKLQLVRTGDGWKVSKVEFP